MYFKYFINELYFDCVENFESSAKYKIHSPFLTDKGIFPDVNALYIMQFNGKHPKFKTSKILLTREHYCLLNYTTRSVNTTFIYYEGFFLETTNTV